jgi:plastocyanin
MTREASKPQKLEIKGGEEVRWVNATGGTAHVMFAGAEGINFYIGKEGRRTIRRACSAPSSPRGPFVR